MAYFPAMMTSPAMTSSSSSPPQRQRHTYAHTFSDSGFTSARSPASETPVVSDTFRDTVLDANNNDTDSGGGGGEFKLVSMPDAERILLMAAMAEEGAQYSSTAIRQLFNQVTMVTIAGVTGTPISYMYMCIIDR